MSRDGIAVILVHHRDAEEVGIGDGSVTLTVEVPVPDGSALYVTGEAHEPF
jgi:hypothetical protein